MFLLDTVSMSNRFKARPDPGLTERFDATLDEELFTSVIVVGELRQGLAKNPTFARSRELRIWLETVFIPSSRRRILPVTLEIAELWGEVCGTALADGRPLPPTDALIAATAVIHELTVVTRNVRDLESCGARVLNPWTQT